MGGPTAPVSASTFRARVNATGWDRVKRIATPIGGAIAAVAGVDYLLSTYAPGALGSPVVTIGVVDLLLVLGVCTLFLWASRDDLFGQVDRANKRVAALETDNARLAEKALKLDLAEKRVLELDRALGSVRVDLERANGAIGQLESEKTSLQSERTELRAKAAELSTRVEELLKQLDAAVRKASDLEKAVAAANSANASLTAKLTDAGSKAVALQTENVKLSGALTASVKAVAVAEGERDRELSSSQRAPFMPSLDVSWRTTGFGVLAPKTVHVKVTNVGPGVAQGVQLQTAVEDGVNPPNFVPAAFWAAIPPRDWREIPVGSLDDFGPPNALRVRVEFNSQFGPCPRVELVFSVS